MTAQQVVATVVAFEVFWLVLWFVSGEIYGMFSKQTQALGTAFIFTPVIGFVGWLFWGV